MPNNLLPAFLSTFYRPLPLPPSSLYHMASPLSTEEMGPPPPKPHSDIKRIGPSLMLLSLSLSLLSPHPCRSERSRGREKEEEEEETQVLDPMVGRRGGGERSQAYGKTIGEHILKNAYILLFLSLVLCRRPHLLF